MNFGVKFWCIRYIVINILVLCLINICHAVCESQHSRCTEQLRMVISV